MFLSAVTAASMGAGLYCFGKKLEDKEFGDEDVARGGSEGEGEAPQPQHIAEIDSDRKVRDCFRSTVRGDKTVVRLSGDEARLR